MTDYKQLCAELLDEVVARPFIPDSELISRARAALAEPKPEGPTAMEIIELADEIEAPGVGQVDLVRAALARWGHQPAPPAEGEQRHPEPVPVSERLPGPEDCDAEGRCWGLHPYNPEDDNIWTSLSLVPVRLLPPTQKWIGYTHWLPAHALPLPQGEVEPNAE